MPEQRFVCYALLYGRVWRVVSTARRRGPRPIPPPQVVSSGLRDSPELELYIEAGLIDDEGQPLPISDYLSARALRTPPPLSDASPPERMRSG